MENKEFAIDIVADLGFIDTEDILLLKQEANEILAMFTSIRKKLKL